MALVLKDRVKESSNTTGTGTFSLGGAYSGFQSFSVIGNSNTTYYAIVNLSSTEWEVGIGTYTASGTTLSRDTILESSNSGSAVNFSAGTKDVFCTYPAEKAVTLDDIQTLSNKTLTNPVINGFTGNTSVVNLGSGQFYKDASGNVGIGTNSPTTMLQLSGSAAAGKDPTLTLNNTTASTGRNYQIISGDGGPLRFQDVTAASERMRIDSSGNVGIGTSNPAQRLDVTGPVATAFSPNVYNTALTGTSSATSGNAGSGISFRGYTTGVATISDLAFLSGIKENTNDGNYNGALVFGTRTNGSGGGNFERVRITSSGNVGIGMTAPSYRLSVTGLNNTGVASFTGNNNGALPGVDNDAILVIGGNFSAGIAEVDYFHNSSTYKGTSGGHRFLQRTGASTVAELFWAQENLTRFYTANTERMRIDSSGNVGIGIQNGSSKLEVAGPSANNAGARATYEGTIKINESGITSLAATGGLEFKGSVFGAGYGVKLLGADDGQLLIGTRSNSASWLERARIDSSGSFIVGNNTVPNVGTGGTGFSVSSTELVFSSNTNGSNAISYWRTQSGNSTAMSFWNGNNNVGSIGVTTTIVTYNSFSDYRLKDNIQPMVGALEKVSQLKPCTYKWKTDGSEGQGFIAHELQEVAPDAVTGEKDAVDKNGKPVYQGIDTSFLVATLTAAIQEQQTLIQSLTARLDAANI